MRSIKHLLKRLGLDQGASERDIRRAYARELKLIDPEVDQVGFQSLHETYQTCLAWAQETARAQDGPPTVEEANPPFVESVPEAVPNDAPVGASRAAQPSPMDEAHQVFVDMHARLVAGLSQQPEKEQRAFAKDLLLQALRQPRLLNIEIKDCFEWCVVSYLANGWRPGNEFLFDAALTHFAWENDRSRLLRFGQPGHQVNSAINELVAFRQQEPSEVALQIALLKRLRSDEQPSNKLVLKQLARAEHIASRFPNLLALTSNSENIAWWRVLDREIPIWQRKLTFASAPAKTKDENEKSGGSGVPIWVWVLVVVMFSRCGSMSHQTPDKYAQPSSYSGTELFQAAARDKRSTMPAYVEQEIKKYFSGAPSQAGCKSALTMGEAYKIGSEVPWDYFGPVYDKFVNDCISAGLWPNAGQGNLIATSVIGRKERALEKQDKSSAQRKVDAPPESEAPSQPSPMLRTTVSPKPKSEKPPAPGWAGQCSFEKGC